MKVLQINCVYQKGSTGKIVYDLHTQLQKNNIESVVCYGRGEKTDGAYKICSELYSHINKIYARLTGLAYGGCHFSTRRLISIIRKENPDIVHLQCINGNFVNIYRLITWLKKSGIRTILTLHAEFFHTANCGYAFDCDGWLHGCKDCPVWRRETQSLFFNRTHGSWKRMKKAFDGFKNLRVVSVSPWLMERAMQSPILGQFRHSSILNGLDTDIYHPTDTSHLRRRYAADDEKIIFFATAAFLSDPTHVKGGYYILELAKRMKNEKVKFLIAAVCCDDKVVWGENTTYLGTITDQKTLAQYYSMADVCILASRRETFSMPMAESLSCGTPMVGFKAGAPETIHLQEHCTFVEYGDIDALEQAVRKRLDEGKDPAIAQQAEKKYAKERMAHEYITLYKQMMQE
ncbi:MAG: glycosyltransferase [Ruminococcaceae bacterium]|nr:glycosyltransferase [Oscillospiraceae bacterium]